MNDRHEEHKRSPQTADEQDYPEPERPTTPDEEAGVSIEDLEDPPQAEGKRDDVPDPEPAD